MQVLTRAPTVHILQLLTAIVTALMTTNSSAAGSAKAAVAPQLWSAVLCLLQHGAPAAKLTVVSVCVSVSLPFLHWNVNHLLNVAGLLAGCKFCCLIDGMIVVHDCETMAWYVCGEISERQQDMFFSFCNNNDS